MKASLTTIQHPTSGEMYAVEIREDGAILRAAGPLHHNDPTDKATIEEILTSNSDTAGNDAVWLQGELAAK